MKTVAIIVVVLLLVSYLLHRSGNPRFWRAVRRHPELAMAWFESDDCWVIVRPGEAPPSRDRYTLGFAVRDPRTNQMVKVHCLADRIKESEGRFLANLSAAE